MRYGIINKGNNTLNMESSKEIRLLYDSREVTTYNNNTFELNTDEKKNNVNKQSDSKPILTYPESEIQNKGRSPKLMSIDMIGEVQKNSVE